MNNNSETSDSDEAVEAKSLFNLRNAAYVAGGLFVAVVAFWAFHGTLSALLRWLWVSVPAKLAVVAVVVSVVCAFRALAASSTSSSSYWNDPSTNRENRAAARRSMRWWIGFTTLAWLVVIVSIPVAGFARGAAIADTAKTTADAQGTYEYRLPWSVASKGATARAGDLVGDFDSKSTTYLPGSNEYSTLVKAREFNPGYSMVFEQNAKDNTASHCSFAQSVPAPGAAFSMNLRRALSFVSIALSYNEGDVWGFCDGDAAKLVVPVTRWTGFPAHQVPAGVVVFDGNTVNWRTSVKAGEFPGPVYPESLAATQRESLRNSAGVASAVFDRAGYDTTADTDGDPNTGNVSEFLLASSNGEGYDFVSPLTPKGKSSSVIAVSTVEADHVTDGSINPLVVHTLSDAREGNNAINDLVKSTFPQLGWATGLKLTEVLPLSADTWIGTLANERTVAATVEVHADRSVCLIQDSKRQCVASNGSATSADKGEVTSGTTAGSTPTTDNKVSGLSNQELVELNRQVDEEINRRLNSKP